MTNPPKDQNTALPTSLPEELQVWLDGYFSDPNVERSDRLVLALLSHIKTLEMQGKWLGIKELPLKQCHEYEVSESVMMAFYYPETSQYLQRIGRVWVENGIKTVIDFPYGDYARLTHWQPLPNSPDAQPEGSK